MYKAAPRPAGFAVTAIDSHASSSDFVVYVRCVVHGCVRFVSVGGGQNEPATQLAARSPGFGRHSRRRVDLAETFVDILSARPSKGGASARPKTPPLLRRGDPRMVAGMPLSFVRGFACSLFGLSLACELVGASSSSQPPALPGHMEAELFVVRDQHGVRLPFSMWLPEGCRLGQIESSEMGWSCETPEIELTVVSDPDMQDEVDIDGRIDERYATTDFDVRGSAQLVRESAATRAYVVHERFSSDAWAWGVAASNGDRTFFVEIRPRGPFEPQSQSLAPEAFTQLARLMVASFDVQASAEFLVSSWSPTVEREKVARELVLGLDGRTAPGPWSAWRPVTQGAQGMWASPEHHSSRWASEGIDGHGRVELQVMLPGQRWSLELALRALRTPISQGFPDARETVTQVESGPEGLGEFAEIIRRQSPDGDLPWSALSWTRCGVWLGLQEEFGSDPEALVELAREVDTLIQELACRPPN